MGIRCIALLSGGLDSMLAIRLMQEQGVEVEAVNFKTMFTCCQDDSAQAARKLGVPLTVVSQENDYLDLVRRPRFGYGKGANPCVDCRIYMFEKAHRYMQQSGAQFLVSGEVVGQRPMSQKRKDLRVISRHSGLDDLLLRPLSAKLLPETLPEREGWVDREQLFDFSGRGRKELLRLADRLGLEDVPAPSTGCALTEPRFSRKVFDLIQIDGSTPWEYSLLTLGRHYRFGPGSKVIVGRRESENGTLVYRSQLADAKPNVLLEPEGFVGPATLLVGEATDDALRFAAALLVRHSKDGRLGESRVRLRFGEQGELHRESTLVATECPDAAAAETIAAD